TYNFATVVDDALMGITHIIRGDDHLSNTPRQIMVYEALGAPVPEFAHISMILGPDGKKLSKRHGATSVEEYRDAGYLSDAFVNYLALLGWSLDGETTIVPRDVLASQFSLDHVSKNPAKSDPERLNWINATYLSAMDNKTFSVQVLIPELVSAGLEPVSGTETDAEKIYATRPAWYDLLSEILKPRTTVSPDVVEKSRFLYEGAEVTLDEKSVSKSLAKDGAVSILEAAHDALLPVSEWTPENIDTALEVLPEQLDLKKRVVFQAVRVAECGNMVSPPLGESMALLGKDIALARLERALKIAR
ncbi:MAG: glutamate--tRNA ligase, partial [Lancefieldella rimae]|nr:glutamate--tRNA ligase [Lancefieldella rimae]